MKSYFGVFHQASDPPADCTVLVFDKNMSIGYTNPESVNTTINWLIRDVECQYELSSQTSRFRNNRMPGELHVHGKDASDHYLWLLAEQKKPWYQKSSGKEWIRNGLLLIGILSFLFLLYLLIVPWLSEKMASKVSARTEQRLGDAVYDAMGMHASEDTAASKLVNEFFQSMDIPTVYDIRIAVVNEQVVNAFALPGGRIVLYKPLLQKMDSYPELAALLCHEFMHVNNKHATKRIFRSLGSRVFLGLLFGKFGAVSSVLVRQADHIKSLTYSRSLEKEADVEGLRILLQRKIDPGGFTRLFRHLEESAEGMQMPEFLASHPDLEKRILYIRAASAGAVMEENKVLQSIYEQLK